jgi:hypothetical protein
LARKLSAGDHDMVQSVLVAGRFSDQLVEYVRNRRRIEEKVVRLVAYHVNEQIPEVILTEVDI